MAGARPPERWRGRPPRWGVIGCGDVTEKKSPPAAWNQQDSSLVAVMRRNATAAADYAKRHGVPRWYGDVEGLLADPEVTAVYIATPPGSHAQLAMSVAAAGKPCMVEKPMARNLPEAAAMVDAFEKAGVPLFVAYYRRAYPRFQTLHRMLNVDRVIGQVRQVSYRMTKEAKHWKKRPWRLNPEDSGGGLFMDLGSHALDMMDFLFGPLKDVEGSASGVAGEPETKVVAHLLWDNGARGVASWDFEATTTADTLEIEGAGGRIVVPELHGRSNQTIIVQRPGERDRTLEIPEPEPVHMPLVAAALDALRSGDVSRCPSTGASAMRTAAAMDKILEEYYDGRSDEFWKRPSSWKTSR